jgi:phage terminase large subunit
LDFNPFNEFWAHTEVLKESDAEMLLLTYEDNEALPPNVISDFQQAILKAEREIKEGKEGYWCNWVKVYVKGQIGNLQGAIFNNWEQVNVDVSKMTPKAYVIDWGFSKDPLAMLAVYEYNGGLLFDELIYDTGLTNSALVTRLNELKIDKTIPIICDSSEPKSIKELRDAVFIAEAADKGGDSVITSIKKMQEFTLFITQGSVNVIKELRRYVWADNKTKDVPIDRDNHAVDAMRYYVLNRIIKKVYYDAY